MRKSMGELGGMEELGSVGEALEQAVVEADAEGNHVELPQLDTTMALCMLRTHRKNRGSGQLTVSAEARAFGDIIIGPYVTREDKPSADALVQLIRAHRWVLNPVTRGNGETGNTQVIVSSPSICTMNRVYSECPKCGHKVVEYKDDFLRKNADHNPAGHRYSEEQTVGVCHVPNNKGGVCGVKVTHYRLFSTALDARPGRRDDPVVAKSQRDQVIEVMLKAWQAGPPADGQPTLCLPRIWAVYDLADVPDPAWRPTDARAITLAERAAAFRKPVTDHGAATTIPEPLGILPYGIASRYHQKPEPISTGLKGFWLESDEVAMGWVSVASLAAGRAELGYRRELWVEKVAEPRQRPRRQAHTLYLV